MCLLPYGLGVASMSTVSPESWQRLRQLLDNALELDAQARSDYIATLRGDDETLRPQLVRMLADHERLADKSLGNAMDLAAPAMADAVRTDEAFDSRRVGQRIGGYRLVRLL